MNIEFIVTFSTTVLGAVTGAYLTVRILIAKMQTELYLLKERVDREHQELNNKYKEIDKEVKEVSRDIQFIKGTLEGIERNIERLLNRGGRN